VQAVIALLGWIDCIECGHQTWDPLRWWYHPMWKDRWIDLIKSKWVLCVIQYIIYFILPQPSNG
jgi:hypothetical protein